MEIKKLDDRYLNTLMKRWLFAPATSDRLEFPARRGSAPRTVMRGLAGHLFDAELPAARVMVEPGGGLRPDLI